MGSDSHVHEGDFKVISKEIFRRLADPINCRMFRLVGSRFSTDYKVKKIQGEKKGQRWKTYLIPITSDLSMYQDLFEMDRAGFGDPRHRILRKMTDGYTDMNSVC